jgi:endo-1,4-beta-D-glucanase Y
VFNVAADFCQLGVFHRILNWAKENVTKEEVKDLLLATDNEGRTVIDVAAMFCQLGLFG